MPSMRCLLAAVLLLAAGAAGAEGGCPPGMIPYSGTNMSSCGPMPAGYGQPAQPAGPHWETRWGAIATDGAKAALGAVSGMRSKRQAKKLALAQCRAEGGTKCKLDLAYYNQCAVMVTGDKLYMSQGAPTIELATRLALASCEEADTNCHVYYSACSMAELVQ